MRALISKALIWTKNTDYTDENTQIIQMKKRNNTDYTDKATNNTDQKEFLYKNLCYEILGCVYDVRNTFGNGQKEKVYQNALKECLKSKNINYEKEVSIDILSPKTGNKMGSYRLDFVIDNKIIMETKAITYTPKKIEEQLYSYLRSTPFEIGYLINFGSTNLFIKRVILTNDRKPYFNKIKHLFNQQ